MSVGWYLEADGVTHRLHDGPGWTDAVMPDDIEEPVAWGGVLLGSFDTALMESAVRLAKRTAHPDSSKGIVGSGYEVRVGASEGGRCCVTVSTQGFGEWSHGSFEIPLSRELPCEFACVVSASDAEKLQNLPYKRMQLWLTATEDWGASLSVVDDSSKSWATLTCSRMEAPGTWSLHRTSQFIAGAVLPARDLQEVLKSFQTEFVNVRLDRYGLKVAPFSEDAAGTVETVPVLRVADGSVDAAFSRHNMSLFAEKLEPTSETIELRVVGQRGVRYARLSAYPAQSPAGWYSLKETD